MSTTVGFSPNWNQKATEDYLPRPIERVKVSWWYRLGLAGVAVTLLGLQAAYLALVVAMGWATIKYLLVLPAILGAVKVHFLTILLMAAPLVAGVIATFFLLKPLLAWPAAPKDLVELRREEEPELFAYVERLCAMVGAPVPRKIMLDLQVNASAQLRRGWWSLFRGDLSLTLGLPLVAGLNLPQFSGVLAHEFGHFSQKAGMRLHFLIASSRMWFSRVAYERDSWDERLDSWRQNAGWRGKILAGVASAAVWLSRAVLRALLYAAGVVSAWFSRQMEFDADRHEASLVGAEVFAETTVRLAELSYAGNRAWDVIRQSWVLRKLPDNFPVLVERIEGMASLEVRANLHASAFSEVTDRWATHPSATERIANVKGLSGLVPKTGRWTEPPPATVLFRDFGGLCQRVTGWHYEQELGEAMGEGELVAGHEFAEDKAVELRCAEAKAKVFGGTELPSRWFSLDAGGELPEVEGDLGGEYWFLLSQWLDRQAGVDFLRAGGKINPAGFQLTSGELELSEREAEASRAGLREEMARLRKRYGGLGALLREDGDLRRKYELLSREQEALLELRSALVSYRVLVGNLEYLGIAKAPIAKDRAEQKMRSLHDGIVERIGELEDLVVPGEDVAVCAGKLLARVDLVAERLLGELCQREAE
jgi:Zn-dependent protease with chaperone function